MDQQDPMAGLTEGRLVHVFLARLTHCVPALVVRVWRDGEGNPPANGTANLRLFFDGSNDDTVQGGEDSWMTSVLYAEATSKTDRTWHWPERA